MVGHMQINASLWEETPGERNGYLASYPKSQLTYLAVDMSADIPCAVIANFVCLISMYKLFPGWKIKLYVGLFWGTSILGWVMNFGYHMSTISNPSLQINTKYEMVHNVGNALIQFSLSIVNLSLKGLDSRLMMRSARLEWGWLAVNIGHVTIVLIISLLDIYVIDTSMRSTEDSFLFTTFTLVVNLVVFVRYLVIVRASVSKQVLSPATVAHLTDVLWRFMLYLLTYSVYTVSAVLQSILIMADAVGGVTPGMISVGKYTASTTLFFRLFSFLLAVTIFRPHWQTKLESFTTSMFVHTSQQGSTKALRQTSQDQPAKDPSNDGVLNVRSTELQFGLGGKQSNEHPGRARRFSSVGSVGGVSSKFDKSGSLDKLGAIPIDEYSPKTRADVPESV